MDIPLAHATPRRPGSGSIAYGKAVDRRIPDNRPLTEFEGQRVIFDGKRQHHPAPSSLVADRSSTDAVATSLHRRIPLPHVDGGHGTVPSKRRSPAPSTGRWLMVSVGDSRAGPTSAGAPRTGSPVGLGRTKALLGTPAERPTSPFGPAPACGPPAPVPVPRPPDSGRFAHRHRFTNSFWPCRCGLPTEMASTASGGRFDVLRARHRRVLLRCT